ncbi:TIGR03086 family metal-binding protein [Microlunatus flavus]|uniref:TIGR03086 family protein n=1 Tax=Microlunatus flavus TaxID=1036181 RepID=A0A1H9MU73_9ACTN|nr:TIGR03086 family metal-binding protein [Microlunatus flavus]SER27141.1 TIGR03086 family protein [Microlunatus flavus]
MTAPTTAAATEQGLPDLREAVHAAQQWVAGLLAEVRPDQLGGATPCADFDVETLVRHVFGVADRLVVMGAGRPASDAAALVPALPDDVVADYRERVEQGRRAWADPAALGRLVEAPFGQVPGAAVLGVYLAENLTHGWDLARATGQEAEADPALVAPAYATMRRVLPPEGREGFPFAEPVEPAGDAGPTERLANWSGRVSR